MAAASSGMSSAWAQSKIWAQFFPAEAVRVPFGQLERGLVAKEPALLGQTAGRPSGCWARQVAAASGTLPCRIYATLTPDVRVSAARTPGKAYLFKSVDAHLTCNLAVAPPRPCAEA
jgi:hypothetical protein